jgi:CubicO group peptidase (beta-lactamase class C family)
MIAASDSGDYNNSVVFSAIRPIQSGASMYRFNFLRNARISASIASMFSMLAVATSAIAEPPKFNADKLAAVHTGMQKFVDGHQICGAVVVVGTSKGIVYHDAVGNQELDSAHPMPKNAIFRIMSMTKPITAMGIMLLVEEGKLSLDDPVEKHLPEFKGQMVTDTKTAETLNLKKPSRPITVRDLLTHTAGQPENPPGLADLMRKRNRSLAEVVGIDSQRPLDFEPGSKWKYSSSGMDTLGRIIEVLSGKSYEQFLDERIFQPLGMHDTTFYLTAPQQDRLAELCATRDGKLDSAEATAAVPTEKPKFPSPAGGLYSTAADLAKLYSSLLGQLNGEQPTPRILSDESLKTMTKTQTGELETGFTPGMSYGYGFAVVKHPQGMTEMLSPGTFGHGGLYGTQGWLDPKKDVFYILLIQRAGLLNSDASEMRQTFQTLAAQAIEP